MAGEVVKFTKSKLPSFLAKETADTNSALSSGVGGGFPVLSIKGKSWAVVRGGEREILTREVDGEEIPAPSVEVVILDANAALSKVYYASGYVEGESEGKKPDCYSDDGIKPGADALHPQAKACASCKWNQWGSRVSESGKKAKVCSDVRRVAVSPAGQLNDPMLLRIPPASLKTLAEYAKMLDKRGVPFYGVVTRIKFDPEASAPQLLFSAVRFVTEDEFEEVKEVKEESVIGEIIGTSPRTVEPAPVVEDEEEEGSLFEEDEEEETPPPPPPKKTRRTTKKTAKKRGRPRKKPEPEPELEPEPEEDALLPGDVEDIEDADLDDILASLDD